MFSVHAEQSLAKELIFEPFTKNPIILEIFFLNIAETGQCESRKKLTESPFQTALDKKKTSKKMSEAFIYNREFSLLLSVS